MIMAFLAPPQHLSLTTRRGGMREAVWINNSINIELQEFNEYIDLYKKKERVFNEHKEKDSKYRSSLEKDKLTIELKEQIKKLEETVDYLKKDEDWLKIIDNWLDKIIKSVSIIKKEWNNFSEMLKKVLKSI